MPYRCISHVNTSFQAEGARGAGQTDPVVVTDQDREAVEPTRAELTREAVVVSIQATAETILETADPGLEAEDPGLEAEDSIREAAEVFLLVSFMGHPYRKVTAETSRRNCYVRVGQISRVVKVVIGQWWWLC